MKVLRYGLYGLLTLLLLLVVGAAIFVATFDANRYKSDIESLVLKHTGRILKIDGEISVTLYPQIGVLVTQASLSENIATHQASSVSLSDRFVTLQSTRLSVALLPLLKGEVLVDGINVEGLKVRLVRSTKGILNLQDLLDRLKPSDTKHDSATSTTSTPNVIETDNKPLIVDIQSVSIKDSGLIFIDEQSQQRWDINDIALSTDRLAPGANGQFLASFRLQAPDQSADVLVGFSTRYQLGPQARRLTLSESKASAEGFWQDLSAMRLDLQFDALAEFDTGHYQFNAIKAQAAAQIKNTASPAQTVSLKVDTPQWVLSSREVSGQALLLEQLGIDLILTDASLGPEPWHLTLRGPVERHFEPETIKGTFSGGLNASPLKLSVNIEDFKKPVIGFDAHLETLDVSSLTNTPAPVIKTISNNAPVNTTTQPANIATPAGPLDFSVLQGHHASGQLRIDTIKTHAFQLTDLQTRVNLQDGRLTVGPHQANVWGGKIKGSLMIDATTQHVSMTESISDVDVAALLSSLSATSALSGRGNLTANVSATGTERATMLRSLTGQLELQLKDGAVKGVDLQAILKGVRAALGRTASQSATTDGQTRFAELSATAVIKNGVAENKDLSIKAPLFRIQGNGTIDMAAGQLNYLARVAVVDTADGQGGAELKALRGITVPIRLSGPIDRPTYRVDISALAAELAKIKLNDDVTNKINKAVPGLGNALRGLFGR